MNQQDAQILVISLYYSLGALHVSVFLLVHHQERHFAPDDGLIKSPKHIEHPMKNKD